AGRFSPSAWGSCVMATAALLVIILSKTGVKHPSCLAHILRPWQGVRPAFRRRGREDALMGAGRFFWGDGGVRVLGIPRAGIYRTSHTFIIQEIAILSIKINTAAIIALNLGFVFRFSAKTTRL